LPSLLELAGNQPDHNPKFTPIFLERFFTGLWLQRAPIRDPSGVVYAKYYGGRPDALIGGINVELTNNLTLARRCGTTLFSSAQIPEAVNSFYAFKQFNAASESITVLADSPTNFYSVTSPAITPVFHKAAAASFGYFLGIGNTLYYGDGAEDLAWQGPGVTLSASISNTALTNNVATYTTSAVHNFFPGNVVTVTGTTNGAGVYNITNKIIASTPSTTTFTVAITHANVGSAGDTGTAVAGSVRNWGIGTTGGSTFSAYAGTGASGSGATQNYSGPNSAGTAVQVAFSGSAAAWNNPGNLAFGGSTGSNLTVGGSANSAYLNCANFGFNIPAGATVTGIQANIVWTDNNEFDVADNNIFALQAGVTVGSNQSLGTLIQNLPSTATYGSSSNLWGATWTPTDINNGGFGISLQLFNQNNTGDAFATAFVNSVALVVYFTVTTGSAWASPSNITGVASGGPYTTNTPINNVPTTQLYATNYSLSVSGTISGVVVNINGHTSSGGGNLTVQLQDNNGNAIGNPRTVNFNYPSDSTVMFGGTTDLWGLPSLSTTTTNATKFGVQITANGDEQTFSLDFAQIIIYVSAAPTATPSGTGSFSGTYLYAYAYANNYGVVSNIIGGTVSASPSSNNKVTVAVVASTDPQVTQIILFRSAAGGSVLKRVPTVTDQNSNTNTVGLNITGNIIDNGVADSALISTQLAALALENTPPPVGLIGPVYYLSRPWGFIGNAVYYATGPDLGNIMGNGNESWNPENVFVFPSKVTKLVPVSVGLLVFTVSDIYIIYGNASATAVAAALSINASGLTLFYSAPFLADIGLLSPFALDVNGTTVYMFTADGQCLSMEPSAGISEIGFPIAVPNIAYPNDPNLSANSITVNGVTKPSYGTNNSSGQVYLTWHVSGSIDKAVYLSDGTNGWFRCNTSQAPDGGFVWSPMAQITGGCQAVQSIETFPGKHQLLIGPGSGGGKILVRNTNSFSDNGTAYPANFKMGSITLAQPGQLAEVGFITCDFNLTGTSPLLGVIFNEINGTFEDLPNVIGDPPALYGAKGNSTTLFANRYYTEQTVVSNSTIPVAPLCRHFQIQIDYGSTDTSANELLALCVFGAHYVET
jgi:hypothetical protein